MERRSVSSPVAGLPGPGAPRCPLPRTHGCGRWRGRARSGRSAGVPAIVGDPWKARRSPGRSLRRHPRHLVGVPHPRLPRPLSSRASTSPRSRHRAARRAPRCGTFGLFDVAHPARRYRAYWGGVRGEALIAAAGLSATFLPPVVRARRAPLAGRPPPGLRPLERLPPTRETARRLGLVTWPRWSRPWSGRSSIRRGREAPGVDVRDPRAFGTSIAGGVIPPDSSSRDARPRRPGPRPSGPG